MTRWDGDARGVESVGKWKFQPLPHNEEAHVIENVSFFAHCRKDRFCRCSRCKPSLVRSK